MLLDLILQLLGGAADVAQLITLAMLIVAR